MVLCSGTAALVMRASKTQRVWLCTLCFASGLISLAAGAGSAVPVTNRFGRELLSYESTTSSYLLPTQLPSLCHDSNCCQEDDYTSAYQIMMLNSTKSSFGGRTYTTFFMNLQKAAMCNTAIDTAGCCNANVSTIWIDVDPELMVLYTTLNSQRWANSLQDSYGYRLLIAPEQYNALQSTTLLSVTVLGDAPNLCPVPDIAPVPGLCSVILEGGTPSNPNACCPRGVSRPSTYSNWVPPSVFTCQSDLAVSPFNLAQAAVSNVYFGSDGVEYVNYALNLTQNMGCREGTNSCCGMHLHDLQVKILDTAKVTGVTINGASYPFTTSEWNDAGSQTYQVLSVSGLNWAVEDLSRNGWPVVITVNVPTAANTVPQLCASDENGAEPGLFGSCVYYLYSDDGYCCPSGLTNSVQGPMMPYACNPTQVVPVADTSFNFMYYEYVATAASTQFTFYVSSDASPSCGKAYCVAACGWQLAVNDALIPDLTYESDNTDNVARTVVQRGPQASITFSYTPGSAQAQYIIRTPAGTPLEQLCRANAYPDQGSFPCAATLRSADVYAVVFFSQDNLVIKVYPDICPVSQPLSASCLQPVSARFNWPDDDSTVVDFEVQRRDPAVAANSGCANIMDLDFEVIMLNGPVGSLMESEAVQPRDGVNYNMTSGVEWSETPSAVNGVQHYAFRLDGVRNMGQICIQNLSPSQPQGTCMVQLKDDNNCFNGFVTLVRDPSLIWSPDYGAKPPGSRAAVIVPAVVVPVVVLLVALLALLLFVRRRRAQQYQPAASALGGGDDLRAPLRGGAASAALLDDDDGPSVGPSDVHLRRA